MHYVIIGKSAAGISAARTVRDNDPHAKITVITGENASPYYRPLLPLVLSGKMSAADIAFPSDPFDGRNITTVLGTVIRVDAKQRRVALASGQEIAFDSLLLAAGAAARKPLLRGIGASAIYPLRTLRNAVQIQSAAAEARAIVVLGGGLVGIKAALALREAQARKGHGKRRVAVVEVLPEILGGRLDRRGAAILRSAVEREGVQVLTSASVKEIAGNGSLAGVTLASGRTITADLVVVATGSRPNCAFLKGSGIKTAQGVLVDESLRTNVPGIYAAGDIAEGRDLITGARVVSGLWSAAREMGRIAALNMTGQKMQMPGFLPVMNASEIAGLPFVTAGIIEPAGKYRVYSREDGEGYRKMVFDKDRLAGMVMVGNIDRAGIYTNMIRNKIALVDPRDVTRRAGLAASSGS